MSDLIRHHIEIEALPDAVWAQLTAPDAFGERFGIVLEDEFSRGRSLLARSRKTGEPLPSTIKIVHLDSPHWFVFEWHPHTANADIDYDASERTKVEFTLEPHLVGTKLTVQETGFESLDDARRAAVLRQQDRGWIQHLERLRNEATGSGSPPVN